MVTVTGTKAGDATFLELVGMCFGGQRGSASLNCAMKPIHLDIASHRRQTHLSLKPLARIQCLLILKPFAFACISFARIF